jgi:hypothetical protein
VLNAPAAASRTDLFPFLLALAALLLPFDVGVRRITVSLRKLFGFQPRLAPALSMEQTTGRIGQLMRAKSRVRPEALSAQARVQFEEDAAPKPSAAMMLGKHEDDTAAQSASTAAGTASELLKRRKKKVGGESEGEEKAGENSK